MRTRTTFLFAVLCLTPLLMVGGACSSGEANGTDAARETDPNRDAQAAPAGLVHVESAHDVPTTVQRLTDALDAKDITVFNTIDHAEGAAGVDMELRPTTLVIFGNPKVGTPLMQCSQTMGIALPMKMLAWQTADGTVRLTYADPAVVAQRHNLGSECEEAVRTASTALENFADVAASVE